MRGLVELSGRAPAIVHWFERWDAGHAFDPALLSRCWELGAAPMISWEPWQGLQAIADGEWDDHLARTARQVTADGQPLFLRFAHEMNLRQIPWYGPPAVFLAAWRRVRAAFADAGAKNVRWVWSPYVDGRGVARAAQYFPGSDLIDWAALDGYNWGRRSLWQRWASFEQVFGRSLGRLSQIAPGMPVMLAEIGCAETGGDKPAWMRDALLHRIPDRHPEVRAVVWFNEHRLEHADWRVHSSPGALAAWRQAAADERYALHGAAVIELAS